MKNFEKLLNELNNTNSISELSNNEKLQKMISIINKYYSVLSEKEKEICENLKIIWEKNKQI